ncbi:MAG: hypothetical protein WBA07_09200 [Rivularia sp. (in: cyanobacteria)]
MQQRKSDVGRSPSALARLTPIKLQLVSSHIVWFLAVFGVDEYETNF